MILEVQNYLETILPNPIQFGQIQDEPDSLITLNLIATGRRLSYQDDNTHVLMLTTFVRDKTFEGMQITNGDLLNELSNVYDITLDNCYIVDTKQVTSNMSPERDYKNRYFIQTTHEMIVVTK